MLLRKKKILAHDENNGTLCITHLLMIYSNKQFRGFVALKLDDRVIIRNCPPISARKRFTLETVLKSPETERTQSAAENQATIQKSAMESAMESPTEHNGPSTTEAQPEA
jgi:hypothetical protein